MNQTITISSKTIDEILTRLDKLGRDIRAIKVKLFEREPLYGSDEWWEWSEKKADEDIDSGRLVKFESVQEAIKWLNS